MGNYNFTLTPTFTQGLVLRQLFILLLVYLVLRYLLDHRPAQHAEESPKKTHPSSGQVSLLKSLFLPHSSKRRPRSRPENVMRIPWSPQNG